MSLPRQKYLIFLKSYNLVGQVRELVDSLNTRGKLAPVVGRVSGGWGHSKRFRRKDNPLISVARNPSTTNNQIKSRTLNLFSNHKKNENKSCPAHHSAQLQSHFNLFINLNLKLKVKSNLFQKHALIHHIKIDLKI